MKTRLLTIIGIIIVTAIITPQAFANENLFYGTSSFERLPSVIVPENTEIIEIKFQYTDGPYSLSVKPIIDVAPKEASSYVHVEFPLLEGVAKNSIKRMVGMITIDPEIPSEKIFLNISYNATYGVEPPVNFKSGWTDSLILDISQKVTLVKVPSSQDYEFETMTGARCDDKPSLCYGTFSNGTTIPIQCDYRHSCGIVSFDDYEIVENVSLKRDCTFGMFVAYKIDNSKSACVFPDTLRELIFRGWAFPHAAHSSWKVDANTSDRIKETCRDKNHILVQGGFYPTRGFNLDLEHTERISVDGYSGIAISLYNPTDADSGSARFGNANVFVDCLAPNVENFYDCQEASHHIYTTNWPILKCRTLDGKIFAIDENMEMSKNSGIELYTTNFLSSHSLEFVGKTDRVEKEISFVITAPDGNDISTWNEFAPPEGEFRTSIATGGPLWKQDGIYTFTAQQKEIPYYTVYLEFELVDGKIVR